MEETTTTESTPQESSGVREINGVPVDENNNAIPDTQLDDVMQDEAGSQPGETESEDTGDSVDVPDTTEETPDESEDDDVKSWAEKKNLPLDDPIKLAKMVRESEQRMHQATKETKLKDAVAPVVSEDNEFDPIAQMQEKLRVIEAQSAVTDFYNRNPDANKFDSQMAQMVEQKPYLAQDLDTLYAAVRFNELNANSDGIRREGGREALTKLANKQQATAVRGNAVDPRINSGSAITPQNVDQLVGQNSDEWYMKNRDAINRAMAN